MFKSSYDNSTHYSREDGFCTGHGVAVAQPDGKWLSIRYVGQGSRSDTMHETRWAAERELEGFHTISTGKYVISRDDISTTWRDRDGRRLMVAEQIEHGVWQATRFGGQKTVRATREDIETWVSSNL